mmetsp:Transcript_4453/g.10154  ORF Transcript_4453/g.10154 Transcript_4453/m.10154 type:complete len:225 (-) Transcript_4453:81-755(-)|eukprot:CAMPEP_0198711256 /NCGR_PEP_ID=MMETSP1471-20131121/3380_1 /TAXON_ID=41880 /ORGANISM="Pycnococcus provasolii, Strain RCC733" /LENGTH=224 /DNA_ID=CAMNT_0044471051 /DNA_START=20 /DNA_END=694 /DNA_ORIENTATION=-
MAPLALRSSLSSPLRAVRAVRTSRSSVRTAAAADREMWLKGSSAPAHLDGSLPGDFGFDPLGLGTDPERLKWFADAEIQNGRWAMLGVTGIAGQEALGLNNGGHWFDVAKIGAEGPWNISPISLLPIQFGIMSVIELNRYNDFNGKSDEVGNFSSLFPIDPMNMDSPSMRFKEVKHARLAMLAFVGCFAQYCATGAGPFENVAAHVSNPFGATIFSTLSHLGEA